MRSAGLGLKAATITPEGADDVGSPNRLIREGIDGTVIVRTGRRIPGVTPIAGIHHPISICRMAVGDAYGAEERREEGRAATRSPYEPSGSAGASAARSPSTRSGSPPDSARAPASTAAPSGPSAPSTRGC